jgi:hypothetical protein
MTKHLAFISLLACFGCSDPAIERTNHPTTPSPSCDATAAALFEIDHGKDAGNFTTSQARVLDSGAWTFDDSTGAHRAGCLGADDLTSLRAAVHGASWKVEPRADGTIPCRAMSAQFVEYLVDGKHVWQDRTCTDEHPDAASRSQLDTAIRIVTAATAG